VTARISVVEGVEIRYEVGVETFEGDCLASRRVRLRPHVANDAQDHVRWRNDAEVAFWATAGDVRFWPVAAVAVDHWFRDKLPEMDPRADGVFAVDLLDGRHIGMVDYRDVDVVAHSATVGITIGEKDLWGQGYGSEALRLLVGYLFDHLNLHRVQLDTWSGNERAMRSFARIGFREEGRLREAVWGPGRYFDSVVMGLLRSEWAERPEKVNEARTGR
jgi:RimJ/RimL family protein N-acetyltransferase